MLLHVLQTLVCGLLGLPPVNGVLPQAPMHTRSLAHIRKCKQKQCSQLQQKLTMVAHEGKSGLQQVVMVPAAAASEGGTPLQSSVSSVLAGAAGQCNSNQPAAASADTFTATQHPALGTSGQLPDNHIPINALQQHQHGSVELRHRHHHPHQSQQQPAQQQQHQVRPLHETRSEAHLNTLPDSSSDGVLLLEDGSGGIRDGVHHQEGHCLQLEVRNDYDATN